MARPKRIGDYVCDFCHIGFTRPMFKVEQSIRRGDRHIYCGHDCMLKAKKNRPIVGGKVLSPMAEEEFVKRKAAIQKKSKERSRIKHREKRLAYSKHYNQTDKAKAMKADWRKRRRDYIAQKAREWWASLPTEEKVARIKTGTIRKAQKDYGEFYEAAMLTTSIERELRKSQVNLDRIQKQSERQLARR